MKLGVYRVWYYTVTEKIVPETDRIIEVSRTSPIMKMVAAESPDLIEKTLPEPPHGMPGTLVRNVVSQVDQRHKDVLFGARGMS